MGCLRGGLGQASCLVPSLARALTKLCMGNTHKTIQHRVPWLLPHPHNPNPEPSPSNSQHPVTPNTRTHTAPTLHPYPITPNACAQALRSEHSVDVWRLALIERLTNVACVTSAQAARLVACCVYGSAKVVGAACAWCRLCVRVRVRVRVRVCVMCVCVRVCVCVCVRACPSVVRA